MATVMHVVFPALRTYAIPFDAHDEEMPSSYRVYIWYGNTRMAGLQSGEGRVMIDAVFWTQYRREAPGAVRLIRLSIEKSKTMFG